MCDVWSEGKTFVMRGPVCSEGNTCVTRGPVYSRGKTCVTRGPEQHFRCSDWMIKLMQLNQRVELFNRDKAHVTLQQPQTTERQIVGKF